MEQFWTVKDALYILGFAITIIGFWHRIESRVKEAAKKEAVVDARLTALEKIDSGHEKRMDDNFRRLFEEISGIKDDIHKIDLRLSRVEEKLEAK